MYLCVSYLPSFTEWTSQWSIIIWFAILNGKWSDAACVRKLLGKYWGTLRVWPGNSPWPTHGLPIYGWIFTFAFNLSIECTRPWAIYLHCRVHGLGGALISITGLFDRILFIKSEIINVCFRMAFYSTEECHCTNRVNRHGKMRINT